MVKEFLSKYFQKNNTLILLLVGFLVVIGLTTLSFRDVKTNSSAPTFVTESNLDEKTEDKVIEGQNCTGDNIIDQQAGFSITCPSNLKKYIYLDEYNQITKKQEKIVFLCESQISSDSSHGYYLCPSGGIMVWANSDSGGGGCNPEDSSTITLNGQSKSYCLYPTGFGQLYSGDVYSKNNGNRFLIEGSFSKSFTRQDAFKVLDSFKTL